MKRPLKMSLEPGGGPDTGGTANLPPFRTTVGPLYEPNVAPFTTLELAYPDGPLHE